MPEKEQQNTETYHCARCFDFAGLSRCNDDILLSRYQPEAGDRELAEKHGNTAMAELLAAMGG